MDHPVICTDHGDEGACVVPAGGSSISEFRFPVTVRAHHGNFGNSVAWRTRGPVRTPLSISGSSPGRVLSGCTVDGIIPTGRAEGTRAARPGRHTSRKSSKQNRRNRPNARLLFGPVKRMAAHGTVIAKATTAELGCIDPDAFRD